MTSSLVKNGSGGVSSKPKSDWKYDRKAGKMVRTTTGKVGGGGRRGAAPKKPTLKSTATGVAAALKKGDVKLAAARVKNAASSLSKKGKSAKRAKSYAGLSKDNVTSTAKKAANAVSYAGRSASAMASNKFNSARKSLTSAAKSGFASAGGNTKLLRAKVKAKGLMNKAKGLAFKFTPARAAALRKAQAASAQARRSGRGGM